MRGTLTTMFGWGWENKGLKVRVTRSVFFKSLTVFMWQFRLQFRITFAK